MSEQKESSVLFSLKELMNLEEDRIRGEEEQKEAAKNAEQQARMAAEKAARDAEEARIRAEEERRRAEETRVREESARLEALRQGEVERARIEAEQQARLTAMSAQQSHERQLEAIRTDKSKKGLRNTLIGLSAGFVVIATVVGVVVYKNHQETERQRLSAEAQIEQAVREKKELEGKIAAQESAEKDLINRLANETDLKKKAELEAQLNAARAEKESLIKSGGGGFRAKPGDAPAKACNCKPTDPLCDCL